MLWLPCSTAPLLSTCHAPKHQSLPQTPMKSLKPTAAARSPVLPTTSSKLETRSKSHPCAPTRSGARSGQVGTEKPISPGVCLKPRPTCSSRGSGQELQGATEGPRQDWLPLIKPPSPTPRKGKAPLILLAHSSVKEPKGVGPRVTASSKVQ